jgi:ATP-dependent Clp protease ATP-binding subunit ClpC
MFEKYTDKARRTIFFARYEASQYGGDWIEVPHLLLGLLRESAATFEMLGVRPEAVRPAVEAVCKHFAKPKSVSVDLPLSHACRRVLGYAAEESERLSHRHIGPEHLLMGVLRENGPEAVALDGLGIKLEAVRGMFRIPPGEPLSGRQAVEDLLERVPEERLAAAALIVAGLSSAYFTVSGASSDGSFSFTFGTGPAAG